MAGGLAGRYVEEFRGVLSLLRFLRRAGRLGEVDKFASAPDAESAVEVLREAMSLVYRRGGYCVEEEIRAEEVSRFEHLCGKECVERRGGGYVLRVRCPRLPTDEELEALYAGLKSGGLKPGVLAALALARRGGRP
ncbi:hypothetical protein PYWP30_00575 [Pyrobaculum sp. WP30]|nr:hypothetical protein PYWP30_00575 [Pyrobaculum sp. WP30]